MYGAGLELATSVFKISKTSICAEINSNPSTGWGGLQTLMTPRSMLAGA
jgi:hypothetical protein